MTTRLVYLAQVLRELADDAEAGRLTGLSVVATRAGGDRPQAIVHHPREKTQADAFFGGLVTNAAIIARASSLPPQAAREVALSILDTIMQPREKA